MIKKSYQSSESSILLNGKVLKKSSTKSTTKSIVKNLQTRWSVTKGPIFVHLYNMVTILWSDKGNCLFSQKKNLY